MGLTDEAGQVDEDKTGSIDFEEFKQIMASDLRDDPVMMEVGEASE